MGTGKERKMDLNIKSMEKIDEILRNAKMNSGIKRQMFRLDFDRAVKHFEMFADARLESKNQKFVLCKEVSKLIDWLYVCNKFETDYTKGILIKGTTGKGKTFLFDVFSDMCKIDEPVYISTGKTRNIRPIKVNARQIESEFSKQGWEGLERYFTMNSLLIDDIGAEQQSNHYGNKVSAITEIIDRREEKNLLTFGTTNCEKLSEIYDDRTVSRIASIFNIWYIENDVDYRMEPNKIA